MAWLDPPNHPDAIIPDWDCIFRKRGAREDGRVKPYGMHTSRKRFSLRWSVFFDSLEMCERQ
jgi:hypothetical protein